MFLGTIESLQAQLISADYSPNCRTNRPRLLEFLMSPQRCNSKSYDYQVASSSSSTAASVTLALTGCERLPPERTQRTVSTAPGAALECPRVAFGGAHTCTELSKPGRHCWFRAHRCLWLQNQLLGLWGGVGFHRGDNPTALEQHTKGTFQDAHKKGTKGLWDHHKVQDQREMFMQLLPSPHFTLG